MTASSGLELVDSKRLARRVLPRGLVLVVASSITFFSSMCHACWQEAADRYALDPILLQAVAQVESGGRADAINNSHFDKTSSRDIGLMQINTRWLKTIKANGYTEAHLRDACSSIFVGAWILSDLVKKYGNEWKAVGAYNAACTQLKGAACDKARSVYAWKVHIQKQKIMARLAKSNPQGNS